MAFYQINLSDQRHVPTACLNSVLVYASQVVVHCCGLAIKVMIAAKVTLQQMSTSAYRICYVEIMNEEQDLNL
jgi:hypothetical protein